MKKSLLIASLLAIASAAFAQTAPANGPGPAAAQPAPPHAGPGAPPAALPPGGPHGPGMPGVQGAPMDRAAMEMAMAKAAIDHFDANKDGKVSKKEFVDAQLKSFTEFDLNHDGFVTPQEMVEFRHKMEAKQRAEMQARMAEAQKNMPKGAPVAPGAAAPHADTLKPVQGK